MRVATFNASHQAFSGIEARQAEQARLQTQLTTGNRVNAPGDDPVAAAQAEMARSRLTRIAQEQRTNQLANSLLSAAEGALGQGVELMQNVRERLVAAADPAYSQSDRQSLATELRSARDSLLALANTRDGAGGFVFGGKGTTDAPLNGASDPAYQAQAGVQRIGARQFAATVDGRAAFMTLPQGNGVFVTGSNGANTGKGWIDPGSVADPSQLTGHSYGITVGGTAGALTYSVTDLTAGATVASNVALEPGKTISFGGQNVTISGTPAAGDSFSVDPSGQQSIFKTLDDAIAALEQPSGNPGYAEKLTRVQASVDRALDSMILMRSRVGEDMRSVDDAVASGAQEDLLASQRKSSLIELDFTKGLSDMAANQTGLEAALKTYQAVAKSSLFQMI